MDWGLEFIEREFMNEILICIPNYNGEQYLSKLQKADRADIVVVDNASTDNSVQICKDKDIEVIESNVTVDRTENWIRCIDYFRNSNYKWMKWLFIGDELDENAVCLMKEAIEKYPSASVIVFNYAIIDSTSEIIWRPAVNGSELRKAEIAEMLISGKNIFGSPISTMISRNAVEKVERVELHNFRWAADVYMHYQIAKNGIIYFENQVIGKFVGTARKHYNKLQNSIWSSLEELELIRLIVSENPDIVGDDVWEQSGLEECLLRAVSTNPKHKLCWKIVRRYLRFYERIRQQH